MALRLQIRSAVQRGIEEIESTEKLSFRKEDRS